MGQLSFFSAETEEPTADDLAGVLAGPGQTVRTDTGTRLSVVVDAPWRAQALVREFLSAGLAAEISASEEGSPIARTAPTESLDALAARWTAGAVKAVPAGWIPSPRALRLWVIASGIREGERYLLRLDPHAPEGHPLLATSLMRAGIAPTLVGARGGTPALRISGKKRLSRLLEYVGQAPAIARAAADWPPEPHGAHGFDEGLEVG